MMPEPANHTAWVDNSGGTWIRVDECDNYAGHWFPRCDGPGFEPRAHNSIGQSRPWSWMDEYAPFTAASPELAAETLELVRKWCTR